MIRVSSSSQASHHHVVESPAVEIAPQMVLPSGFIDSDVTTAIERLLPTLSLSPYVKPSKETFRCTEVSYHKETDETQILFVKGDFYRTMAMFSIEQNKTTHACTAKLLFLAKNNPGIRAEVLEEIRNKALQIYSDETSTWGPPGSQVHIYIEVAAAPRHYETLYLENNTRCFKWILFNGVHRLSLHVTIKDYTDEEWERVKEKCLKELGGRHSAERLAYLPLPERLSWQLKKL